ncbi:hypothetical protein OUZ56_018368 [Daphnia magna]|uniref:Uncharacterized protein n=1 Tax=Daphnia magna TaxID=35525 RepID=A0ABQ9Z8N2_9CRUS|nr:hypothetical protein OUZ56_018368 [Daphnia magna]
MPVSMPDSFMTAFIHLAIVLDDTCPCGALSLTYSFSSAKPDRKAAVALTNFLMASTGHSRGFSNVLIEMDIKGPDRCVLRRVDNEKRTASSEKTKDFRSIAAISATLIKEASATRHSFINLITNGCSLIGPPSIESRVMESIER